MKDVGPFLLRALYLVTLLSLLGCLFGSNSDQDLIGTDASALSVAIEPDEVEVLRQSFAVTAIVHNSFAPVTLEDVFAPTGITVTQNSNQLRIDAGPTAPSGTSNVRLRIRSQGRNASQELEDRIWQKTLRVTVPVSGSALTVNVSPSTIPVAPGGSATAQVALDSSTVSDRSVNLEVVGVPTGWTAVFTPASVNMNTGGPKTATLTIGVPLGTSTGRRTLTVSAQDGLVTTLREFVVDVAPAGIR